jgi:hypothetical protein
MSSTHVVPALSHGAAQLVARPAVGAGRRVEAESEALDVGSEQVDRVRVGGPVGQAASYLGRRARVDRPILQNAEVRRRRPRRGQLDRCAEGGDAMADDGRGESDADRDARDHADERLAPDQHVVGAGHHGVVVWQST